MPAASTGRYNALSVKGFGNASEGRDTFGLQALNGGPQALRSVIRVRRYRLQRCRGPLSGPSDWRGSIWVAKADTSGLRSGQGGFGPIRDELALLLCHKGHDAHREVISVWHIGSDKPDTAILEGEKEGGITRKPIQLGDHKAGTGQAGTLQRL